MSKNITSILFVSSSTLIAGLLSYLYHPVMIRYLSIEDFGSFQSILSVLNLLWVFITAIGLFYVKQVSKNINNLEFSKSYRKLTLKYFLIISLCITVFFFLLVPLLSGYLDIPYYYFLFLGFTIIGSFLAVTNTAFLQSLHKFNIISALIVGSASIKLLIGFILVYFGFNIFGALGGFIISQILMFILGYYFLERFFKNTQIQELDSKQVLSSFLSQKKQILQYLATSILIALFMNIDILIVKNMFDGETAGYYAAVSVLAKFLVFLGLSIETVYYPQLVKEAILPKAQVLKISVYYIAMTAGAIVFFMLFGEFILRMFKSGLEEYIGLIYPLLVYCGLLAYLSVIVKTLIAFERYRINYILGFIIVGLVVSLYRFGSSPLLVTEIFAVFGGIGLMAGLWELRKK